MGSSRGGGNGSAPVQVHQGQARLGHTHTHRPSGVTTEQQHQHRAGAGAETPMHFHSRDLTRLILFALMAVLLTSLPRGAAGITAQAADVSVPTVYQEPGVSQELIGDRLAEATGGSGAALQAGATTAFRGAAALRAAARPRKQLIPPSAVISLCLKQGKTNPLLQALLPYPSGVPSLVYWVLVM